MSWVLVALATVLVLRYLALPPLVRALAALIRRAFGGYEHLVNDVDETAPEHAEHPKRVLVVGAGLAGIGAAANLAEAGLRVTLWERNAHLGGKVGAWNVETDSGLSLQVEHGFHAFFRHYYNLNRFLDRVGVRAHMKAIDDYLILERDGRAWRFATFATSPVINLIDLARGGLYRFRDILFGPALHEMDVFLTYDESRTFAELDDTSYQEFADRAQLPASLRLVFNTFARAFFTDDDKLSMAELVKSFHFYYLSHDHGLLYDYPDGDYQQTVLAPIQRHLEEQGVTLELGRGVDAIAVLDHGFEVDGQHFDHVVLATSSVGASHIAMSSPDLAARSSELAAQLDALRPSQHYAVWRIWIDRRLRDDIPVFVATERHRMLDSVTAYHRITTQAHDWAQEHGGSVLELHSYALPRGEESEAAVRAQLTTELVAMFPELDGFTLIHEHLQVNADFTAFHVGMASQRPTTTTPIDGLYLAGDWVKIPIPAMLMEAAYSSGLLAANAILRCEGVRERPVLSVPRRGLLASHAKRR